MSFVDIFILVLLIVYAGIGALRGSLRELLSLGVWLLAIVAGWLFADAVSGWFEHFDDVGLRRVLAFLLIVLVMLILLTFTAFVVRQLLPRPSPGMIDRGVGALVGALRGAALVVLLVVLAGLTPLPKKDDWRNASVVGVFQPLAEKVLEWLPPNVARHFRYG